MRNEVAKLIKENQERLVRRHEQKMKKPYRKMKVKQWYAEQKSKAKCVRCGESDTSLLTYHHRDPTAKDYDVTRLASWLSIKRLKEEMDKCDVLCVTCHRKEHNLIPSTTKPESKQKDKTDE